MHENDEYRSCFHLIFCLLQAKCKHRGTKGGDIEVTQKQQHITGMHFGKWQGHGTSTEKSGMLKPAHESEAVIFWVKALRADL